MVELVQQCGGRPSAGMQGQGLPVSLASERAALPERFTTHIVRQPIEAPAQRTGMLLLREAGEAALEGEQSFPVHARRERQIGGRQAELRKQGGRLAEVDGLTARCQCIK